MNSFTTTAGKIFPREKLQRQVEIWRDQGLTVVMTNGCYDLLHAGHIHSLESARSFGHVLIVAINSDASVRMLKGDGRPLNNEDDRARVIAALSCVDAVTIFCESTASELLNLIRPHVYVKGGDYNLENLPERDVLLNFGIELAIVPLLPGRSTTGLIASARE